MAVPVRAGDVDRPQDRPDLASNPPNHPELGLDLLQTSVTLVKSLLSPWTWDINRGRVEGWEGASSQAGSLGGTWIG